jgi:hypothetical protein
MKRADLYGTIAPRWTFGLGLYLDFLGPRSDIVVVLAFVTCVEVRECGWSLLVVPDLAQNGRVDIAHQLLANNIQAVGLPKISHMRRQVKE